MSFVFGNEGKHELGDLITSEESSLRETVSSMPGYVVDPIPHSGTLVVDPEPDWLNELDTSPSAMSEIEKDRKLLVVELRRRPSSWLRSLGRSGSML